MIPQHTQQLLRGAVAGVAIPPADGIRFESGDSPPDAAPPSAMSPAPPAAAAVDEVDDEEFIKPVVPIHSVGTEGDEEEYDADAWLAQQRDRVAAAAEAVRSAGRHRQPDADADEHEPTVRATSAGGRYDDGIPERTIEDVEREERERLAAVEVGDAAEQERVARVQRRTPSIAASLSRGAKVPIENVGTPQAASEDDDVSSSRAKPVRCIEDGRVFGSMRQAAESLKIEQTRMRRIIAAGRKFKGKRYEYVDAVATATAKTPPAAANASRHYRPVVCVDPFRIFPTETAACAAVGVGKGAVRMAIKQGVRAGGYVWRDATSEEIAKHLPDIESSRKTKTNAGGTRGRGASAEDVAAAERPTVKVNARPIATQQVAVPTSHEQNVSDLFFARAMIAVGRSPTLRDVDVVDAIVQVRALYDASKIIQAIERGGELTTLGPWQKAGA